MALSVKSKLVGNAILASAITLVVGVVGFMGILRVDEAMNQAVLNGKALRAQMDADMGHDTIRSEVYAALLEGQQDSGATRDRVLAAVRERGTDMVRSMQAARMVAAPEVKLQIEKVMPEVERYAALANEVAALAFSNPGAARGRLAEFTALFQGLEASLEGVSDSIGTGTEAAQQGALRTVELARIVIVVSCVAAAIALLVISWLIARAILLPLDRALHVSAAVAAGDLTVRIDATARDEFGHLLRALEKMRHDLAEAMGAIQDAANSVNTGSKEIARGNADLSSRTEEQASSLEQTASSMEELTTTVKLNADSASQANHLAIGASEVATRGGEAMRGVVETMQRIAGASRKIADIISVIDGISFQTNILALNAAVEAARAGEQGRGFAVVASEVRALAQRSATAAKEIKSLIEESVGRVGEGTHQVEGAGETMQEIVTAVKRVTDIVSEIATASHEQLRGIEQVSQAVVQMDHVVQQNAALVEESAAAAEHLSGQSEILAATAGRFKLEGTRGPVAGRSDARPQAQGREVTPRTAPEAPARSPRPTARGGGPEDWVEF